MFREWDTQCGGGLRRKAVVGQLHEVTDLLQESHSESVTRRLFRITAELAELAGWMSYDVGLQPTAQKYCVLALHAAKEAGDRPLGAFVLSSMSRQMIHLEPPRRRPGTGPPRAVRQPGHRERHHPGDAARSGGPRLRQPRPGQQVPPRGADGRGHLRRRPPRRGPGLDQLLQRSRAATPRTPTPTATSPTSPAAAPPTPPSAQPEMRAGRRRFRDDPVHQRAYALNLVGMATVHLLSASPSRPRTSPSTPSASPSGSAPSGSTPGSARPPAPRPATSPTCPRSYSWPSGFPTNSPSPRASRVGP